MIKREFIRKRLGDLIIETKKLLNEIPPFRRIDGANQDVICITLFNKWKLSCSNFLRSSFGENHYFLEEFKDAISHSWQETIDLRGHKLGRSLLYSREQVAEGYATLLFIKEQIDLDLVSDAQHLYEAGLFSNLIEQAFELLKNDYKNAAAIYGRIVIENTIKDLCRMNKIEIQNKKMPVLLTELRKMNVIDLPKEREIQAKYDIGSLAAHGKDEFNKYNKRNIEKLLEFIRDEIITIE